MSPSHAASARRMSTSGSPSSSPAETALDARRGFRFGAIAALGWLIFGGESILRPQPRDIRDALFLVPWIFTIVTFSFVHRVQRKTALRWEQPTFYVLIASMLAVTLGSIGIVTRTPLLLPLAFPWGVLVWMIAMITYGIATWRTRLLPRSTAMAFVLLEPGSILFGLALNPIVPIHDHGGYSGAVAKGVALALMARDLRGIARRV